MKEAMRRREGRVPGKVYKYNPMTQCKCCGNSDLQMILDLNRQPLANNLIEEGHSYDSYELAVNLCRKCFHTQLTIAVNQEELFSHYLYVSGTSKTITEEFKRQSRYLCDYLRRISPNVTTNISVLDIASNDGTLLKHFKSLGCDVLGIDPATNLCEIANREGIKTINAFFGHPDTPCVEGEFDIITAFNVFAHIENPADFMKEIYGVLSSDGICAIQTSQRDMFFHSQFDTIYHEHHHFYSIMSFYEVCKRNNFYLYDVRFPDIHGGSYLFVVGKDAKRDRGPEFVRKERSEGRYKLSLYNNFSDLVKEAKIQNLKKLEVLRRDGYKMIGFGAAAKGIVLLNYYDFKLDYVIDENPLKVGKIVPNINARVISLKEGQNILSKDEKLCFIVLPWNFAREISTKINSSFSQEKEIICIFGSG